MNPKNNDDKCFQYTLTIALNYQNIKKFPQRITKITAFIDQYNWKEIDWKNFELNNKSIALNILFVPYNTEKIRLAYTSKYNSRCKNQVVLLMITDGKKWHYFIIGTIVFKKLSALLRGVTSKHDEDFYCLNYFHSHSTEKKLKKHENVCNDHDCYVEMPKEENKRLKCNHGEKSMKVPFIIYSDLACLLKKCTDVKIT